MSSRRPRVLFLCLNQTSFVKDDLELLRERYDVRVFRFDANRFSTRAGRLMGLGACGLKQLVWLRRELPHADLVYGWFADYHLALPVLLARAYGVPVAVALGGFDCNYLPELNYGVWASRWRAPLARLVVQRASLLLPVAQSLVYAESRYASWPEMQPNGVSAHVANLSTPYRVIPFGYDAGAWALGPDEREAVVCTVALIASERTLRIKGIDLLFEAARALPEAAFQVVGLAEALQPLVRERYDPPENVTLLPPRPRDELPEVYRRASVYAQLSRTEGLPNVVCEAMCCGCIPVVSKVGGMPELVGESGFVVEAPRPEAIADTIREALKKASPEARQQARQRIVEQFSTERRRQMLFEALDRLIQSRPAS